MGRKKLSLRTPGKAPPDGGAVLSEDMAAALGLIEKHGPRAGQVLVDEAQAAIKAGDDVRVSFLERVRIAMASLEKASPPQPQ